MAPPITAVIVDDETLARDAIRLRLKNEPDIEVVGEAADGADAVELVRTLQPDLMFLDVQMPVMDGFEVVEKVASDHLPIVVFVTAHDRYALKAFETHALDYLLKPFTASRFHAAIDRARLEVARAGNHETHAPAAGRAPRRAAPRARTPGRGRSRRTRRLPDASRCQAQRADRAREGRGHRLDRVVRQLRAPPRARRQLCRPHDDGGARTPARSGALRADSPFDDRADRSDRGDRRRVARRLRRDAARRDGPEADAELSRSRVEPPAEATATDERAECRGL